MPETNVAIEFISTFVRIMVYPIGALALLNITVRRRKHHLGGAAIAAYFMYWMTALVIGLNHPGLYHDIVNYTATPLLVVVVIALWAQVWQMRHE